MLLHLLVFASCGDSVPRGNDVLSENRGIALSAQRIRVSHLIFDITVNFVTVFICL